MIVHSGFSVRGLRTESSEKRIKTIKGLSLFYTNARSIIKKRDELVTYVMSEKPDIVSITETWLNINEKHLVSEVNIHGYNMFLNCRETKRGGGVILYNYETLSMPWK